jgi:hypothetical protein
MIGCGKGESGTTSGGPAQDRRATPTSTGAATATAAPKSAQGTSTPPPVFKPTLTAGRTSAPTLEEWDTQKKEVTVKGSSALSCETKIVREYLRVSCKGKNDTGGTPTAVRVIRGGHEAQTFAAAGIASMVVPFVEGINLEAVFSWTNKSHLLTVKWPKGSNRPVVVGVFEGAKSPLDGTADGNAQKLCECYKKITRHQTCESLPGGADADCDRTWGDNCQKLVECSIGDPHAAPACLPGFVNGGASGHCFKVCSSNASCPSGRECLDGFASTRVCM